MKNRLLKSLIPIIIIISLFCDADTVSVYDYKLKIIGSIRLNDIVFFEIENRAARLENELLSIRLLNENYKTAIYQFDCSGETVKGDPDIPGVLRGYFYLPNVLPIGQNVMQLLNSKDQLLFQNTVNIDSEIVFYTPLFVKGWVRMASEVETGMRKLEYESYPESKVVFASFNKKSYFLLRVKSLSGSDIDKILDIYLFGDKLDSIKLADKYSSYVYLIPKNKIADQKWYNITFKIRNSGTAKIGSYVFEYINQISFNRVPVWANDFLKNIK